MENGGNGCEHGCETDGKSLQNSGPEHHAAHLEEPAVLSPGAPDVSAEQRRERREGPAVGREAERHHQGQPEAQLPAAHAQRRGHLDISTFYTYIHRYIRYIRYIHNIIYI